MWALLLPTAGRLIELVLDSDGGGDGTGVVGEAKGTREREYKIGMWAMNARCQLIES